MLGGVGSINLKYNVKIFVGAARAGEAAPYLLKWGMSRNVWEALE